MEADEASDPRSGARHGLARRIAGWALGEHHDAALAYGALAMVVAVHGGKDAVDGVIFRTNQGSEHTASATAPRAPGSGSASPWAGQARPWTTR
jgi:hypothetical protein